MLGGVFEQAVRWEKAAAWPEIADGIHLWRARFDGACKPQALRAFAAGFLERVLRGYLPGQVLGLRREESGRPWLAGRPFDFNLSHADAFAVVAVRGGGRVGVDIECMDRAADCEMLADRFFAREESAQVREGGAEMFFRLWTCKEAALKAVGAGLAGGLDSTRPAGFPRGRVRMRDGSELQHATFAVDERVVGAVAWPGDGCLPLRFLSLD